MSEGEQKILALIHAGVFSVDDLGRIWRLKTGTRTGRYRDVKRCRAEHKPDVVAVLQPLQAAECVDDLRDGFHGSISCYGAKVACNPL